MHLRTAGGLDIAYTVGGRGRAVVFLHPIGTRSAFWRAVIEALGDGYRSLAVDLRGHGGSRAPAHPFSLADLAGDVVELIRAEGADGAVVVGCSLGGMVAQGVAAGAPDLVAGLVLAGTSHKQTPESRAVMEKRAAEALAGMESVAGATLERWFPAPFRAAHPETVAMVREWLLEMDPATFSLGWRAIRDLDYEASLPGIASPVLLMRGSEDAATPLVRMQAMTELLPNARLVSMPGLGHFAPMEEPREFAKLVRDFIENEVPAAY